MFKRYKTVFLALVLVQGLHSIEEYLGELWEVFPPAAMLCGLISDDLEKGFLIANIGIFIVGLIVWFFLIRLELWPAKFFIWFWIVLELINGMGHIIWAISQKSYMPGLFTAPILFMIALYLARIPKT